MAAVDPTGLIGALAAKLLDIAVDEVKKVYQCKDKCQALDDLVKKVRPSVSDFLDKLPKEKSGTVLEGLIKVKHWLDDLETVLTRADTEVLQGKELQWWNPIGKPNLYKKVVKTAKEIENMCSKQPFLPLLNVVSQTYGVLCEIKEGLDRQAGPQQNFDNLRPLPDKVFGTQARITNLENLLLAESGNKFVGICGLGGIGKTLLAELAFNSKKVRNHFQSTFWLTVGQNPSIEDLLQNLAKEVEVITESRKPQDITAKLFNALEGKRVLLVLDDVWENTSGPDVLEQLKDVTKATGSKILVTTRHTGLLKKRHALSNSTLMMDCLSKDDSWELFCEHSFKGVDNIPRRLDKTMKAIVDRCKGHPLALKVTGRALAQETNTQLWERKLLKLRTAPFWEEELFEILRLSYDSLKPVDPRLQKCFVYFAAFPEDYDVDSTKLAKLWAGEKLLEAGDNANDDEDPLVETAYLLGQLVERSLIDLRKSVNPLHIECRVHDVLRDFALYLIKTNQAPMACLFQAGEDLREVPKNWLLNPASNVTHISLYNNPLESLPTELTAPKLEVLLLSRDNHYLGAPLAISPAFLESFSSLKVLDLENRKIGSLPDGVGNLKELIHLDLSGTGLLELPREIQELTNLEYFSVRHCSNLKPWPFDISRLKRLLTLDTQNCTNIWDPVEPESVLTSDQNKHLRWNALESLCKITTLHTLSMSGNYEHLPEHMDSLSHLTNLSLYFSRQLVSLPNLYKLQKLSTLSISQCHSLPYLPSGFAKKGAFPNLLTLGMSNCYSLKEFPPIEEGAFPRLVKLDMELCSSLQQLPTGFARSKAFPALEILNMSDCRRLKEFPPIEGAFPRLVKLNMGSCSSLQQLPAGFGGSKAFPALEILNMSNCRRLKEFPCIEGAFPRLVKLYMESCSSLQQLPTGFGGSKACRALEILDMSSCRGLKELPPIEEGAFPQLVQLNLGSCSSLQQLPVGFGGSKAFPALKVLEMSNCGSLKEFPPIEEGAFPRLVWLSMRSCSSLQQFPVGFGGSKGFRALEILNMSGCGSLKEFPPIEEGAFPRLVKLDIGACCRLQQLPTGFGGSKAFRALKRLDISYCIGLQEFPSIEEGAFPCLEELDLSCCAFEALPTSLSLLRKLEDLDLKEIDQLKTWNWNQSNESKAGNIPTQSSFVALKRLGINGRHLNMLPSDLYKTFPALKTIDMRNVSDRSSSVNVDIPENLQILEREGKLNIIYR